MSLLKIVNRKYVDTRINAAAAKLSKWANRIKKIEILLGNLTDTVADISTLLASDDVTLDGLQEIVSFIKQNKTDLDTLAVSNIAGLQLALDGKATDTHGHSTYEVKNTNIQTHISARNDPHNVTKSQVGLGSCNNTSDANKPVSTATQTAIDGKENKFSKASGFNKSFGTGSGNVARGNHTHSGGDQLEGTSTSNGGNNEICGLKKSYPGGDVPDGWENPIAVKTNLTHPANNKPIYLTGLCWSGFLGVPPQ